MIIKLTSKKGEGKVEYMKDGKLISNIPSLSPLTTIGEILRKADSEFYDVESIEVNIEIKV